MVVRAEKISRQYFRKSKTKNVFFAVQETDITLPAGKLVEIMGHSGSGKSTLLHMLAGILTPTTGSIFLDDTNLYALEDRQRSKLRSHEIGVVPQGQTGLHSLTVLENVLLPYRMYGEPEPREAAMELLETVGIAELCDAYPNELSGGEMRRLSIARALIRKPAVLLADEPTGDLDDTNTHTVLRLLRKAADQGAAVLLVTHEPQAAAYADAVYQMNQGILTAE